MHVLIAGCGDVGIALGEALARAGHRVSGLRRRPAGLPASIGPVAADLSDPASLERVPEGLDAVVYLAAADERSDAAYRRAYVDGPRHLLTLLGARGEAPRFLFASSTGVYGQSDGAWVDEASPTEPRAFSGRRLLEGEALVLGADLAGTVVRLAGIYGPGRTRLIDRVRSGEARATAGRFTNRIHRDDAAGIFAHLLERAPEAPVWLGVDDEPALEVEVLGWLAARLGVPPPREGPADPADGRGRNKRCSNRRLRESGFAPRYPSFREGYAPLFEP